MYNPKYFTLYELAKPHNPTPESYLDSFDTVENLSRLGRFLDIMRESLKHPVKINSGFRSRGYNKQHGGVDNSWHCSGCAADCVMLGTSNGVTPIWRYLSNLFGFDYNQCSLDTSEVELIRYPTFVHIAIKPAYKF